MFKKLAITSILLPLFLSMVSGLAQAQYNRPGSTSADFLQIGVSARAAGMGDAYISAVNGADATYYNPAALPLIKSNTDIYFNHTEWFAGINHEFMSVTQDIGRFSTVGASLTALYSDPIKVTTPSEPDGTGETFYVSDFRGGISYARKLTNWVSFGATASLINEKLFQGYVQNAFSVDIAALYHAKFRDFKFAMMIANLGSQMKYVNESYPLPTNFSFGASINAIDGKTNKVLISGSAKKPNSGAPVGQIGLEYSFKDMFFLRGGYKINYDAAKYSAGAGVKIKLVGYDLHFDYGYSDYGILGVANRFSFELSL